MWSLIFNRRSSLNKLAAWAFPAHPRRCGLTIPNLRCRAAGDLIVQSLGFSPCCCWRIGNLPTSIMSAAVMGE
jgi:hypothetical protein